MSASPVATAAAAAAFVGSSSSPLSSAAAAASPSRVYRILHLTDIHFTIRPTWRECWAEPKRLLGLLNYSLLGRSSHFSRHVQRQLVGEVQRHRPTHVVLSGDLTSFASDAEFELAYDTLKPILRPPAQPYTLHSQSQQPPAVSFSSTSSQWTHRVETAEATHSADTDATDQSHSHSHQPPSPPASPSSSSPSSSAAPFTSFRTVLVGGNHDVYTFGSVRSRLLDRWFGHWRLPTARILSVASDLHFVAIDACQPNRISSHGHVDEQQVAQ